MIIIVFFIDYKKGNVIKEIKKTCPSYIYFLSELKFHSHKAEKLKIFARKLEIKSYIAGSITEVLESLKNKNKKKKLIIITGSIGLIGDFLNYK